MKKRIPTTLALAATAALLATVALPTPAAASLFSIHGAFSIGNVHFGLGWASPPRYARGPAVPYYRVAVPLRHPGYDCSSLCYRADGLDYHHYTCPRVLRHFRSFGYAPPHLELGFGLGSYGPGVYLYGPPRPYPYGYRAPAPRIYLHHHHHHGYDGSRGLRYGPGRGPEPRWWDGGRDDRRHDARRARPRRHH